MIKRKKAILLAKNELLYKLISLELYPEIECEMRDDDACEYDFLLYDYDEGARPGARGIGIGHSVGADIPLPFPIGELKRRLLSNKAILFVDKERLCATLGDRIIKLTEIEATLLDLIIKGGESFVRREDLHKAIWAERATDGALNVYIHYLRRKLEGDGERVIISSRSGYRINERYL